MKSLILVVILMVVSSSSVADPDRSFSNSIAEMEGIQFIYDNMPGMYSHIYNEWQQTNINKSVAIRADGQSKTNAISIENLELEFDDAVDDLNAGIAGAMAAASLPFAMPGKDAFLMGISIYGGETAIAIGVSSNTGDGELFKFSFTSDTAGNTGTSIGVGFDF